MIFNITAQDNGKPDRLGVTIDDWGYEWGNTISGDRSRVAHHDHLAQDRRSARVFVIGARIRTHGATYERVA